MHFIKVSYFYYGIIESLPISVKSPLTSVLLSCPALLNNSEKFSNTPGTNWVLGTLFFLCSIGD